MEGKFMSLPMQQVSIDREDDDGETTAVKCRAFGISPDLSEVALINEDGAVEAVAVEEVTFAIPSQK